MSERKEEFTPGPWMLTYRQSSWGTVMDIDGGPDGDWVARLGMTDESEVGRANAALLLAAPEMYENERVNVAMLKVFLKLFEDWNRKQLELFRDVDFQGAIDALREQIRKTEQLLAKARGEVQG